MPPRIPIRQAGRCVRAVVQPSPTFSLTALFAGLAIQSRSAHILARLSDNPKAYNKKIRLGRGPSSGKGKTSGRGQKGQKAHGHVHPWFQGGQTPLIVRHGTHGFENLHRLNYTPLNLGVLAKAIDEGRLDPAKPINIAALWSSRLLTRLRDGVKLLATGKEALKHPLTILCSKASASAIAAVEAAGGRVTTRYYTRDAMRRVVRGQCVETDKPLPVGEAHVEQALREYRERAARGIFNRLPDPTSRKEIEYYRDPAHRGYMSHLVAEGESPSLFYGVPEKIRRRVAGAAGGKDKLVRGKRKAAEPALKPGDRMLWEKPGERQFVQHTQ